MMYFVEVLLGFIEVLLEFVDLGLSLLLFLKKVAFLGVQLIKGVKFLKELKLGVFL